MKVSSELSTGVRLTGSTIAHTPRGQSDPVAPAEQTAHRSHNEPDQPDMKDAGIGRKLDIKI